MSVCCPAVLLSVLSGLYRGVVDERLLPGSVVVSAKWVVSWGSS